MRSSGSLFGIVYCLHKKASHCAVFAFLCSNGGSIRLYYTILDGSFGKDRQSPPY